jgi:hypothetical protein
MVSFETWMLSSILVVPPLVSGQSSTQMKQKESESATENTKIHTAASPAPNRHIKPLINHSKLGTASPNEVGNGK